MKMGRNTELEGKHGRAIRIWHENGQKKLEENFKNRQWNGSLIEWHKNGQKANKTTAIDF